MIYSIHEDVPESWEHIIMAFITSVEYGMEFNRMPEVYNLEFQLRNNHLFIHYCGGNHVTDGMAILAQNLSVDTCATCGARAFAHIPLPICSECLA